MTREATLDPECVRISHHALDRYLERRGWRRDADSYARAESRIRELLDSVKYQQPSIYVARGRCPSVRYQAGDLAFVLDEQRTVLITFYVVGATYRKPNRQGRRGR